MTAMRVHRPGRSWLEQMTWLPRFEHVVIWDEDEVVTGTKCVPPELAARTAQPFRAL